MQKIFVMIVSFILLFINITGEKAIANFFINTQILIRFSILESFITPLTSRAIRLPISLHKPFSILCGRFLALKNESLDRINVYFTRKSCICTDT